MRRIGGKKSMVVPPPSSMGSERQEVTGWIFPRTALIKISPARRPIWSACPD